MDQILVELLEDYGYLAVLIGCVLEGETVLILAGFAAQQGLLSFPSIIAFAVCGGALGDQSLFLFGRYYRGAILRRYPSLAERAESVRRLILHHDTCLIIGLRFMYGIRLVGPIAIGMSNVVAWRFVYVNLFAAAAWAVLFVSSGYLLGHAAQSLISEFRGYEEAALQLFIAGVVSIGFIRIWRHRGH